MADEFSSGNWWDTSTNRSFNTTATTPAPPVSTKLNSIASFGWPTEMVEMKSRSLDSGQAALQDGQDESGDSSGSVLANNLQMMGLGLTSQGIDWNQALIRGEKLQEDMSTSNTNNFLETRPMAYCHEQRKQKLYSSGASSEDSSTNEYKQINRAFSLDQQQFNSYATSDDNSLTSQQNSTASFHVDPATSYGMLLSENQQHPSVYESRSMNYLYPPGANAIESVSSWNKFLQFMSTSPSEQATPTAVGVNHLHFSNNTQFWNASTSMNEARSSFFPGLQNSIPASPFFDEKTKNASEVRDLGRTTQKSGIEMSNKRPRNETPSSLPAFKVRKEKMGDRITALQQLVSPFGKTDTASVLSEAIEYIKFLHEQVTVLSTPYMKNGVPIQHQQNFDDSKDPERQRQDLRSRGLCLVPAVSSTFPVTHETMMDYWTPAFGGTFR